LKDGGDALPLFRSHTARFERRLSIHTSHHSPFAGCILFISSSIPYRATLAPCSNREPPYSRGFPTPWRFRRRLIRRKNAIQQLWPCVGRARQAVSGLRPTPPALRAAAMTPAPRRPVKSQEHRCLASRIGAAA